ncbi:hypothetical protein TWF281_004385 [Arthrobotrys megalospora]
MPDNSEKLYSTAGRSKWKIQRAKRPSQVVRQPALDPRVSRLERLPAELLMMIFDYIPEHMMLAVSFTCGAFYNVGYPNAHRSLSLHFDDYGLLHNRWRQRDFYYIQNLEFTYDSTMCSLGDGRQTGPGSLLEDSSALEGLLRLDRVKGLRFNYYLPDGHFDEHQLNSATHFMNLAMHCSNLASLAIQLPPALLRSPNFQSAFECINKLRWLDVQFQLSSLTIDRDTPPISKADVRPIWDIVRASKATLISIRLCLNRIYPARPEHLANPQPLGVVYHRNYQRYIRNVLPTSPAVWETPLNLKEFKLQGYSSANSSYLHSGCLNFTILESLSLIDCPSRLPADSCLRMVTKNINLLTNLKHLEIRRVEDCNEALEAALRELSPLESLRVEVWSTSRRIYTSCLERHKRSLKVLWVEYSNRETAGHTDPASEPPSTDFSEFEALEQLAVPVRGSKLERIRIPAKLRFLRFLGDNRVRGDRALYHIDYYTRIVNKYRRYQSQISADGESKLEMFAISKYYIQVYFMDVPNVYRIAADTKGIYRYRTSLESLTNSQIRKIWDDVQIL